MNQETESLQELKHIKMMMERSSKFLSLSGLSGISAGLCALAGGWLGARIIDNSTKPGADHPELYNNLLLVGGITFLAALLTAIFFTWLRSRSSGLPLWGPTTYRVIWSLALPILTGGLVILRCGQLGYYDILIPASLIFYGIALISAAKHTLGEVRILGYAELVLGSLALWLTNYSIYIWLTGFGVLHIIYGCIMWWKYERIKQDSK